MDLGLRLMVAAAMLAGAACDGPPSTPAPSAQPEILTLRLETAHFRVYAGRAAAATLSEVADRLEAELPRVSADLGVSAMPVTTVEVWTDRESFYLDMQSSIGRRVDGATGYVVGAANVTILQGTNDATRAAHEQVHCVSLRLNSTIGNNPRWLWETVALYENGDFVDPRTLAYLRAGSYPTLAQLSGDYSATVQIYDVGYLLGEFIVASWGRDGLVRLVQANGDVPRICGITTQEFEQRWAAFVQGKYFGG